jgi:hypothetical protein
MVPGEKRQERPQRLHRYLRIPSCLSNSRGPTFREHAGHLAMAKLYVRTTHVQGNTNRVRECSRLRLLPMVKESGHPP